MDLNTKCFISADREDLPAFSSDTRLLFSWTLVRVIALLVEKKRKKEKKEGKKPQTNQT